MTTDSPTIHGPDLDGPLAFLGGPYSNHIALRAVLTDARGRGARRIFCLGDLGGFGPNPGKIYPLLEEFAVAAIAGNYDESLANRLAGCGCGYWLRRLLEEREQRGQRRLSISIDR